jgi:hypothetical protein
MAKGKRSEVGIDVKAEVGRLELAVHLAAASAVQKVKEIAREARAHGALGIDLAGRAFVVADMLGDIANAWAQKSGGEAPKKRGRKPKAEAEGQESLPGVNGVADASAAS